MKTSRVFASLVLLLAFVALPESRAENWDNWRGPFFNGSTTETNLPVSWSKTENIAWVAPMPGACGSSPIVWGDRVFVASPDADQNLVLLCLNRPDGKSLWRKTVTEGNRSTQRSNMGSPSPVTDGKTAFVIFGTGDLAAFDFSGNLVWSRQLAKEYGRFTIKWLYGSSPLLYDGKLFIEVIQRSPKPPDYSQSIDNKPDRESFLLCLDPKTGTNLWRQLRSSDARDESQEAYSSPIPKPRGDGPAEILLQGAGYVTAHDADTGAELWRCGGMPGRPGVSMRTITSPLVAGDMIIACAPQKEPVFGIRDGGKGVVTDTHHAWAFKEFPSDCATPLYYQEKLFVLDGDHQMMTCLDPKTGQKLWQGGLGANEIFRASPTGADGKIYCIGENGTAVVLSAGGEFKILATIPMGEDRVRASIAIASGQLFIRTGQNLYCVGGRKLKVE